MKKIINSILAFVTLFSVTSCDLDMDPETAIRPEDAYTMEYCEGVRGYVYVDLKRSFPVVSTRYRTFMWMF